MRPPTAQALMRSRYTAYTRGDIDYIESTLAPEQRSAFDRATASTWAMQAKWLGLQILFADAGGPGDREGVVAFVATYSQGGQTIEHHETSYFRRGEHNEWLFVSGDTRARRVDRRPHAMAPQPAFRSAPKVGRNDPCPCGSGKKFKKCCGA
jgi:SEC-C motif-containing protein